MNKIRILWTDDEIELLKPHILFLEEKGYEVHTASNGHDAIRLSEGSRFDVIFLDEHMPGLSGLETLDAIKKEDPSVPVVIITKSEEEDIMDQAIGSKIADYLIKPVNPKQILLSIKKILDNKRLVSQKIVQSYQSSFYDLGTLIARAGSYPEWVEIYKRLVYWDLEMEESGAQGLREVLRLQHEEANKAFVKFVRNHYAGWFDPASIDKPVLSTALLRHYLLPLLDEGRKVMFLLIDNLRYDQWKVIYSIIQEYYLLESEALYCSILPTATQYARNAIFAGLMPKEISELFQELWVDEDEETSKNLHEEALLKKQLARLGKNIPFRYEKVNHLAEGNKLLDTVKDVPSFALSVVVYNFVDILSHARTEVDVIREMAYDEAAFRSLTRSWFIHSPLYELIKALSRLGIYLVVTTDHGSVRVQNPLKVVGDKQTSTNLRYKQGRNLNYNPRDVYEVKDPAGVHLPRMNVSTRYIFAGASDFFAYPNNYNYYVGYYRNTFQHGGISMEEMLVPVSILSPKSR